MKAGVAVDDWKLPVFRKRLTEAGFTYTDGGAPDDVLKLKGVVERCQKECAASGPPRG